jgi:hypothetical protein
MSAVKPRFVVEVGSWTLAYYVRDTRTGHVCYCDSESDAMKLKDQKEREAAR